MMKQENLQSAIRMIRSRRFDKNKIIEALTIVKNETNWIVPSSISINQLKDILGSFNVLTRNQIVAILKTGSIEQICELTALIAIELIVIAETLPNEQVHQLSSAKYKDRIYLNLKERYPKWFISIEKTMADIDQKHLESPARILYFRTLSGDVAVKFGWKNQLRTYQSGISKEIRHNKGLDSSEYELIISYPHLEDFLSQNEISCEDVWVEDHSLKKFYCFNGITTAYLTPSFVDKWYNYDAPTLFKISPNIGKYDENIVGMSMCHSTQPLVEGGKYVAQDITSAEANALMKGNEHTEISKEIQYVLKAQQLKASEVEKIQSWIVSYEAKIQSVINGNAEIIKNALIFAFYDRYERGSINPDDYVIYDDFGMDDGYLNISVNDKLYLENKSILRKAIPGTSYYMELQMPIFSMSTTFMLKQFEIIKKIVFVKLGIELTGQVVLD